jgi:hypothetical protein
MESSIAVYLLNSMIENRGSMYAENLKAVLLPFSKIVRRKS